jgi:hypothetical protein
MAETTPLILSWENPTDLWNPIAHKCQVWRQVGVTTNVMVCADATWGYYLDKENSDPTGLYSILYMDGNGSQVNSVLDPDIERYARPDNICEICFEMTQRNGHADSGLEIEVSDEAGGTGDWRKTVLTNSCGKASFFLVPNCRLLLRIDGQKKALDFVVPNLRFVKYPDLFKYGTLVPTDPRQSIGFNDL